MSINKIRLPVLIAWQYLKRNKLGVILALLAISVLTLLQFKFNLIQSQKAVRVGLVGTYQEHDLPSEVTKLLSTGLLESGTDGRIKPNLVTGWDVNHDATQFKFKIKNNLKWADNTKVKSTDLSFAIPNTTVSFPDDNTVQFDLKEPYSPLPSLLIKPVFKKGTLIGMGPYRIAKIEKSVVFITKITLQSPDPKLPAIYIRFYPNEKVALTGFNLGEVEALLGVSKGELVSTNPLVAVKQTTDYSKIVTVLLRTNDSLLRNRSLRQALAYQTPQIPKERVADNPYPISFWAYNKDSKKYLANPAEAKAALDRAKSQLSEDQVHSELILTATPNLSEVGKVVAAAWRELGFDSKLRVESGIPQNFQALLITQSIPADPDQYFLWHATQTKTNLTKYDSKRVDKDLEDGRKAISEDERKAKYFDFQKTLLEDAPAIFLYFPKYNIVYLKKIEPLLYLFTVSQ